MDHYSIALSLYLRNQHISFEKCNKKLNKIGIPNNNRNQPLDIIKLPLLILANNFYQIVLLIELYIQ